jgi:glycine C-acetyltransferase
MTLMVRNHGSQRAGTGEHFGVQDEIDVYFANICQIDGRNRRFSCQHSEVVKYLRFNLRSRSTQKSLPMAMTLGAIKRLETVSATP